MLIKLDVCFICLTREYIEACIFELKMKTI